MLSSVNINAICISSLSSSVYFSWVLDKNYWRSSIAYHLFVKSATFFSGMRIFPKWWREAWLRWSSWCWLAVLVCLCGPSSLPWNLVFCSLSQLEYIKKPLVVSPQRTTCIYLGAASRLCLFHSETHSRQNHHWPTVPYCNSDTRHWDQNFATSTFSNPLQINFLATGTLAANDFHSALPTPVRLLIHSSCFSWSRWCMCFMILLMCHICCIVAYTSLSSF